MKGSQLNNIQILTFAKKMHELPSGVMEQLSYSTRANTKALGRVLEMFLAGSTIPFIARYRKEYTGGLNEIELGNIAREFKRIQDLMSRKETILDAISKQEKLTEELRQKIERCWEASLLEDLYIPFKKKRKTRADKARELGLEPLAKMIFSQRHYQPGKVAQKFIDEKISSIEEALQGARDIIAEWINESERARSSCRSHFKRSGELSAELVKGMEEVGSNYKDYFGYSQHCLKVPSHRLLAIFRAEKEGILKVKIRPNEESLITALERKFLRTDSPASIEVKKALLDSLKRLLLPSMETEFRNKIRERADREAIAVFGANLRQLLLAPPLGSVNVLAIDPGFRSGCKTVCLNSSGDLIWHGVIFPLGPQLKTQQAADTLVGLCDQFAIQAIAVGNGTGGRETIDFLKEIESLKGLQVYLVNEAGASIYSASEVAIEEFPDLDLTVRGAISIGRRLMDPLAELVKVDPRHIGVGQYQHDVNQKLLVEILKEVVELCVNSVGINLNTASSHLLTYVSGLGPSLARSIVDYRKENGAFQSRSVIKKVKGMGLKAFEQSAGFLRVRNSNNPLDNTGVHPERYPLVKQMAKDLGLKIEELIESKEALKSIPLSNYVSIDVGLPTLQDIISELEKPGLDPRGKAKEINFSDIKSIEELREGMIVKGIVSNLAKFGAFVDLGIKASGLIHISEICDHFIRDPAEVLRLGQSVEVKVLAVDIQRNRISLSKKGLQNL